MRGFATLCAVTMAFGAPALADADAWSDLQKRCAKAVLHGERLDVSGLEDRLPDFLFDLVEDDLLGPRVEPKFSGPGGRTVPTGVWGVPDGAFELWLIEYPTQAGFRAICEVRTARGFNLDPETVAEVKTAFEREEADPIHVSRAGLVAYRLTDENARGCAVVTSLSTDGKLRSTVSEAAGMPQCGGPSLASGVITPHGVLPPKAGG